MNRISACGLTLATILMAWMSCSVFAAEPISRFAHLEQGWTETDRTWFYSANQGSRLVPYEWFLALEVPDGEQLFRDASRMERLHYLSRPSDPETNPDGLPIGFVKDPARGEGGRNWLGLTCAACHTSQINYRGVAYRIDGGPGHGDIQTFLEELATALEKIHTDDAKFQRFSAKVLGAGSSRAAREKLRADVVKVAMMRRDFQKRNATKHPYGYARVDAFGIIMNEVLAHGLDLPQNAQPPNAPVSYPFLWDTPHHDFVQWNGAAPNRPLGTHIVGPLARNVGEVLGVFGELRVPSEPEVKPGYGSSAHVENLFWIEQRLKKLRSPRWPEAFPAINPALKSKGEKIFARDCRGCHQDIDRSDPRRRVTAVLTPLEEVNSDPLMATNFAGRTAKTGRLEGRPKLLLVGPKFGPSAPAAEILRHVIKEVIQRGIIERAEVSTADELAKLRRLRELPDRTSLRDLPTLQSLRDLRELVQVLERLQLERLEDLREFVELAELLDLSTNKLEALDQLYRPGEQNSVLAYKARPLNGIWATAPYLHNGSVANLDDLLRPAVDRAVSFNESSREFDPVKVGFATGDAEVATSLFKVKDDEGHLIPGNSNQGHEYGTGLSEAERRQLLEYLKSL